MIRRWQRLTVRHDKAGSAFPLAQPMGLRGHVAVIFADACVALGLSIPHSCARIAIGAEARIPQLELCGVHDPTREQSRQ